VTDCSGATGAGATAVVEVWVAPVRAVSVAADVVGGSTTDEVDPVTASGSEPAAIGRRASRDAPTWPDAVLIEVGVESTGWAATATTPAALTASVHAHRYHSLRTTTPP
jgi:hypothetical protein